MRKFMLCILSAIMLVFTCAAKQPEDWNAESMDPTVRSFVEEVVESGFLDEALPYEKVIHVCCEHQRPELSAATVVRLLRYIRMSDADSPIYYAVYEGDGMAKALGFVSERAMQREINSSPECGNARSIGLYEFVKSQSACKSGITKIQGAESALTYSSPDDVIVQSANAVARAFEYNDEVLWIVCPGYNDYYYDGKYLFVYDMTDDNVTLQIDVDSVLECDTSKLSVPIHVYTSQQLYDLTENEFTGWSAIWQTEAEMDTSVFYDSYYTLHDVEDCMSIFDKYTGNIPVELKLTMDRETVISLF